MILNPDEKFDLFIDLCCQLILLFGIITIGLYWICCFFHWTIGNYLFLMVVSDMCAFSYIRDKEWRMINGF